MTDMEHIHFDPTKWAQLTQSEYVMALTTLLVIRGDASPVDAKEKAVYTARLIWGNK